LDVPGSPASALRSTAGLLACRLGIDRMRDQSDPRPGRYRSFSCRRPKSVRPAIMTELKMADRAPLTRPRTEQLVQLMQAIEVDFVNLTECLVSPGYRLALQGAEIASVHYALEGEGRIVVEGQGPEAIRPHRLVIVPAGKSFRFEVDAGTKPLTTLDLEGAKVVSKDSFHRIEAGEGKPRMTLICGNFRCRHGAGQDLFSGLRTMLPGADVH
jgi:mannose-6-phosphate isomerase-like protein (cupin superfamily)